MANDNDTRSDVASLNARARRLYEQGLTRSDVLRHVYGVDLPAEAYLVHDLLSNGPDIPVQELLHPWDLVSLSNPAWKLREIDDWSKLHEESAFAAAPDFIPLMELTDSDAVHGGHMVGYSIEALKRGETTVLGYQGDSLDTDDKLETLGNSLLGVLHESLADSLRMVTAQRESPRDRRYAPSDADVEAARSHLEVIERLQNKLTGE